jgi:hypothetical protein
MTAVDQAKLLGDAWDRTPHDVALSTRLAVHLTDGRILRFSLGAHAPDLSPDDVERIHTLWLDAVGTLGTNLHHRDVVTAALRSFEEEMRGGRRKEAVERLKQQMRP